MKIELKRKNDLTLNLVIKREQEPVDITGWVIKFSVKEKQDEIDGNSIFPVKTAVLSDPSKGKAAINIDAEDTSGKECKTYYWDLLCIDSENKRQNSETGMFEILQEVTDGE